MIPLIINDDKLRQLRSFAEAHRISLLEMLQIMEGQSSIVGDREGHSCDLDVGWHVVYSVEEHPRKDGQGTVWLRHMSMSQVVPGRYPNQFSLALVSKALGFPGLKNCAIIRPNPIDGVIEVLAEVPSIHLEDRFK